MSKLKKNSDGPLPEDLIQTFAAAVNFPRDRLGVIALGQALWQASNDFHIPMEEIVRVIAHDSPRSPTPADIRSVALGMRDRRREASEVNKHAEWERIYGPADPGWSQRLLAPLMTETHADQKRTLHEYAIRCTLYYTEGEGVNTGDREFWEGSSKGIRTYGARQFDLDHYPEMVNRIRAEGGWRTERELQEWEGCQA